MSGEQHRAPTVRQYARALQSDVTLAMKETVEDVWPDRQSGARPTALRKMASDEVSIPRGTSVETVEDPCWIQQQCVQFCAKKTERESIGDRPRLVQCSVAQDWVSCVEGGLFACDQGSTRPSPVSVHHAAPTELR